MVRGILRMGDYPSIVNNDIVMAGEDTFLTIEGTPTQSIPLNAFKPTLPQWA